MSEASERVKRWRKANPGKYRAQKRAQYAKNKEKERVRGQKYRQSEGGKAARKAYRAKNRVRENEVSSLAKKRRHKSDPRTVMLQAAKRRAKRDGIEFSLCRDDIAVPEFCPLLGIRLCVGSGVLRDGSPTIDRIFNSFGYVPGNVIVVSHAANRCKGNLNSSDIERLAVNLKKLEACRAAS